MRSFTFSSENASPRAEFKALALALVALLLLDGYAWVRAAWLPVADGARLKQLPAEVAALGKPPGIRAVLLGNSLTRNAYDLSIISPPAQSDVRLVNGAIYGAGLIEWYYILRNIVCAEATPDVVVLNLSPESAIDIDPAAYRLAWLARETRLSDVPELFARDLPTFEQRADYLHQRLSAAYLQRFELRWGVMAPVVPDYQVGVKWVHNRMNAAGYRVQRQPTYEMLGRLLNYAAEKKIGVVVVFMPTLAGHPVDPKLREILAAARVPMLVCDDFPGLTADAYEDDGWHLNPLGKQKFSEAMVHRIVPALRAATQPSDAR